MSLHRTLIPLRRFPVFAKRFSSTASSPSSGDPVNLFRQINKFASEGKWDSINNAPKLFLFCKDKADVYKAYYNLVPPNANIFARSPYGQYMKALWRTFLLFGGAWALAKVYELTVPEEYRLHYKYREEHDEHAKH